jgi:glycosyltransferase involved in cell wall biosynthesis
LSQWFWRGSLKNKLRVLLAKFLISKADRIRVVSERIKKSLVISYKSLADKISVLPIFVDKEKFTAATPESRERHGINKDDFLILTVARKAPEKNIDLANEIVGELKRRGLRVKWLHIGYGPKEKEEKKWLDEFIENPEAMASYYKMADLFLLTSNYEGYGMAAVEAAAAGVPVVMTDVGVALGATFPVGDKDRAVEIIENLIKNPKKRIELVAKQNVFFKNWSTKEEYLEKFKQCLTF